MNDYFSLDFIPQETNRIILKKIDLPEYFDDFHNYSLQEELYKHLEFSPFLAKEDTRKYLDKLNKRILTGKADYRYLIFKENNEFVGLFGFNSYDNYRRSIEFGYGVSPSMQRRGIFKEVSKHLIKSLFIDFNIHRIYSITAVKNNPSSKGLEKIGFQREGILRDFYKKNDNYFDAALYSLINNN
tara:strand:- start:38984 stop:39538 length:555 start_codon:yes stop_codon:yes gene_type:complete